MIAPRHVEASERLFANHGGWMTAAGRCIPVVRGLIAYPAGAAQMGIGRFLAWSTLGTAVWTAVLVSLGLLAAAHLDGADRVFGGVTSAISILLALVIAVGVLRARRARRRTP